MSDTLKGETMDGIKQLWASVLVRSAEDLRRKHHKQSAVFWFNNDLETGVGSFCWICELLKMDPDRIRDRIFKTMRVAA